MIETYIDTVKLNDGNIQKYQVVSGFEWDDLKYRVPEFDEKVLIKLSNLYKENIIPKEPSLYGILIFYKIPSSLGLNLSNETDVGIIYDETILLNYYFQKAVDNKKVEYINNKIIFDDDNLQRIYNLIQNSNLVSMAYGKSTNIQFMPVYEKYGFMSKINSFSMMVDSHFFLMDMSDKDSEYDLFGTPHGLAIYKNKIILPPLNHRKALFLDYDNNVEIKNIELENLEIIIDNISFKNKLNCKYFFRPENRVTCKTCGMDIIIVNKRVVATKVGGESRIPMAGFVIQVENILKLNSLDVEFLSTDNYKLGIQVGPALMIDGVMTSEMNCPFYHGKGTPYPSTVYPPNFNTSRASRIGLGEKNGKPLLIWAEGAGKLGYTRGMESCGASLSEFAIFCKSKHIKNLINLDGGGSAQLIINKKRYLKIADRLDDKVTEDERAVPNCWVI
jgi:hypothetical protein